MKAKMMSAGIIWAQCGCCKALVCVLSLNQRLKFEAYRGVAVPQCLSVISSGKEPKGLHKGD